MRRTQSEGPDSSVPSSIERIRTRLDRVRRASLTPTKKSPNGENGHSPSTRRLSLLRSSPNKAETTSARVALAELEIAQTQQVEHGKQMDELIAIQEGLRKQIELLKLDRMTQASYLEKLLFRINALNLEKRQLVDAVEERNKKLLAAISASDHKLMLRQHEEKVEIKAKELKEAENQLEKVEKDLHSQRELAELRGSRLAAQARMIEDLIRERKVDGLNLGDSLKKDPHLRIEGRNFDANADVSNGGQPRLKLSPKSPSSPAIGQQMIEELEKEKLEMIEKEIEHKRALRTLYSKLVIACSDDDDNELKVEAVTTKPNVDASQLHELIDILISQKQEQQMRTQRLQERVDKALESSAKNAKEMDNCQMSINELSAAMIEKNKALTSVECELSAAKDRVAEGEAAKDEVVSEMELYKTRTEILERQIQEMQGKYTEETGRLIESVDDKDAKLNAIAHMLHNSRKEGEIMKIQLSELNTEKEEMQIKMESMQKQVEMAEATNQSLEKEIKIRESETQKAKTSLETFQKQMQETKKKLMDLKESWQVAEEKHIKAAADSHAKYESKHAEKEMLEEVNNKLKDEKKQILIKLMATQENIKGVHRKHIALAAAHLALRKKLKISQGTLNSERKSILELKLKLNQADLKCSQLAESVKEASRKIEENRFQKKLQQNRTEELKSIYAQLESMSKRLNKADKTEEKLYLVEARKIELEKEKLALSDEHDNLKIQAQADLDIEKQKSIRLEEQNKSLKQKSENLEQEKKKLIKQLHKEAESFMEFKTNATATLAEKAAREKLLQKEIENLDAEKQSLREICQRFEKKEAKLQRDTGALEAERDRLAQIVSGKKEQMKTDDAEQQKEMEKLQASVLSMLEEKKQLTKSVKDAREEITALSLQTDKQQNLVNEKNKKLEEALRALQSERENAANLLKMWHSEESKRIQEKTKANELRKEVLFQKAETQILNTTTDFQSKMVKAVDEAQGRIMTLEKILHKLNPKIEGFKSRLKCAASDLQMEQRRAEKLENQIEKLRMEFMAKVETCATLKTKLDSQQTENSRLIAELQSTNAQQRATLDAVSVARAEAEKARVLDFQKIINRLQQTVTEKDSGGGATNVKLLADEILLRLRDVGLKESEEMKSLKDDIKRFRESETEREVKKAALAAVETNLEKTETMCKSLQAKISKLERDNERNLGIAEERKARIGQLEVKLREASNREHQVLEKTKDEWEKKLRTMEREVLKLRGDCAKLKHENKSYQERVLSLKSQRKLILKKLKRYNAFYEQVKGTSESERVKKTRTVRRINQLQNTLHELAVRLKESEETVKKQEVALMNRIGGTGSTTAATTTSNVNQYIMSTAGGSNNTEMRSNRDEVYEELRESLIKQMDVNMRLREDYKLLEAKHVQLLERNDPEEPQEDLRDHHIHSAGMATSLSIVAPALEDDRRKNNNNNKGDGQQQLVPWSSNERRIIRGKYNLTEEQQQQKQQLTGKRRQQEGSRIFGVTGHHHHHHHHQQQQQQLVRKQGGGGGGRIEDLQNEIDALMKEKALWDLERKLLRSETTFEQGQLITQRIHVQDRLQAVAAMLKAKVETLRALHKAFKQRLIQTLANTNLEVRKIVREEVLALVTTQASHSAQISMVRSILVAVDRKDIGHNKIINDLQKSLTEVGRDFESIDRGKEVQKSTSHRNSNLELQKRKVVDSLPTKLTYKP